MRRPFVILTGALALAFLPALLSAQTPPAQQPPAQQPPAQPAATQTPEQQAKEPRMALTSAAGMFLFQVKPDQTTLFEDLAAKVKAGLMKSDKPERKQQLASWKMYKAGEPMAGNALYVLVADPAVKGTEYDLIMLLAESLGPDAGTPENQDLFKKYVAAFAAGANRVSLTPIGGGM